MARGDRLQVGFLLSTRGYAFGGLETTADHLAAGLAARGHAVTFLAGRAPGRPPRRDVPRGIRPIYLPLVPLSSPLLRASARALHQSPLNLQSLSFFLNFLGRREARRELARADVVVTFLEGEAVLFSRYLARRGIGSVYYFAGGLDPRWAYRDRSTVRVATSQTLADHCLRHHNYPSQGVVTPGIDRDLLIGPLAADRSGEPSRLLSVGRLEPNKRLDRLLPLVAGLTADFPSVTLRIVGEGPARPSLERAIRDCSLSDRVILVGALAPAQVYDELRQADLFLFPSASETFGLAALEALAAGVPVIASDLPALREATGGHADLLPPDDPITWQNTIRRLLTDRALRRTKGQAGHQWAAQATWDRVVERFETFLYQAADDGP